MYLYSYIFILIAVLIFIYLLIRFKKRRITLSTLLITGIVIILGILIAVFPEISVPFATILGFTRGLDFVFIVAIIILLYICIKLFFIVEDMQDIIDNLIKEVALNNEIKSDDDED